MRQRMQRVGALVAVLFVINAGARLASRFAYGDGTAADLAAQDRLGWIGWGAIALAMAVTAGWWIRRRPQGPVGGELAVGAGLAGLLYVTVGPLLSEPPRYDEGIGNAIIQLAIYLGVAGLGALAGALLVIAAGRDYTSRSLRQYAASKAAKPHRPVRR